VAEKTTEEMNKARSATQLIRAQQAEDGRRAMAEYEAKAAFVRTNTERLRALRLAQEATRPPEPVAVKAKPAAKVLDRMKAVAAKTAATKTTAKKPAKRKAPAA
jgi:hypothetical protein